MSRQLGEKAARAVQSVELGSFASEEGTALLASLSELEPFISRLGPQRSGEILCAWRDALSHAVFEAGGVLLSTDGLSARVVFRHQKNASEPASAVRAALACRRTFGEWLAERMPRIRVRPRFGVHTGRYVAGVWGAKETPEWVAVGEAVEGAFHLEQAAAPGEIIASPSTIAAIGKQFDLGPIDPARLAGTPEELAQSCAVFGSAAR
jgi:class 3 adenylate cyclase